MCDCTSSPTLIVWYCTESNQLPKAVELQKKLQAVYPRQRIMLDNRGQQFEFKVSFLDQKGLETLYLGFIDTPQKMEHLVLKINSKLQ